MRSKLLNSRVVTRRESKGSRVPSISLVAAGLGGGRFGRIREGSFCRGSLMIAFSFPPPKVPHSHYTIDHLTCRQWQHFSYHVSLHCAQCAHPKPPFSPGHSYSPAPPAAALSQHPKAAYSRNPHASTPRPILHVCLAGTDNLPSKSP